MAELDRQRGGAAAARIAGERGRGGVELEDAFASGGPLIAPLAHLAQRPCPHPGGGDKAGDLFAGNCPAALPASQRAIAMGERKQRRYQQRDDRFYLRGGIAPCGPIAGGQLHQQGDRLHLAERAARDHAAIIAHHLAQLAQQPGLAIQAAGMAIGQQQTGGDDRAPARHPRQPILALADMAIEPAGGVCHGHQKLAAQGFVGP